MSRKIQSLINYCSQYWQEYTQRLNNKQTAETQEYQKYRTYNNRDNRVENKFYRFRDFESVLF